MNASVDSPAVVVRAYQAADRPGVRHLSYETGDRGRPMAAFLGDRDLAADLLTAWYTDRDPQHAWVAVQGDAVVGYALGCLDSTEWHRDMRGLTVTAVLRAILRGAWWDGRLWRLAAANCPGLRGLTHRKDPPAPSSADVAGFLDRYPAHVHVNVLPGHRGQDLGRRLITRFVDQATAAGQPGIHASVREDNEPGRRFFERMGFVAVYRRPLLRAPWKGHPVLWSVMYARTLS